MRSEDMNQDNLYDRENEAASGWSLYLESVFTKN